MLKIDRILLFSMNLIVMPVKTGIHFNFGDGFPPPIGSRTCFRGNDKT